MPSEDEDDELTDLEKFQKKLGNHVTRKSASSLDTDHPLNLN